MIFFPVKKVQIFSMVKYSFRPTRKRKSLIHILSFQQIFFELKLRRPFTQGILRRYDLTIVQNTIYYLSSKNVVYFYFYFFNHKIIYCLRKHLFIINISQICIIIWWLFYTNLFLKLFSLYILVKHVLLFYSCIGVN